MSKAPNIVYILTDDQRHELLGCAGHPILKTPNLDTLAAEGTRFTSAFCTSPLCTPSRACHYLGQWERRHGVNFNSHTAVAPQAWAQSFPDRLKQAGYFLGWVGKNHVPVGEGGYSSGYMEGAFDYWYGNHGHCGFYPKQRSDGAIYHNAKLDTQIEIFAEGVRNFLEPNSSFIDHAPSGLSKRPSDQPFCLCVTFNLPHANGTGGMRLYPSDNELYITGYRDRFMDVPIPETYQALADITKSRLPREVWNGVYLAEYDYVRSPITLRERRIREYQVITGIDRFVGELRKQLQQLSLADNTIIVFSTDHGVHHGEHGLGGKAFLYEQDIRIPLILYDPRQPAEYRSRVCDELVAVPDLAPTILELTGLEVPEVMQGRSLVPLLRGETPPWRDAVFTEQLMDIQNYPRSESIRTHEWKYIRYFKRTEDPAQAHKTFRGTLDDYNTCLRSTLAYEKPIYEELYHLKTDPGEITNLADDLAYTDRLDELRTRLLEEARALLEPDGGVRR